MQKLIDIRIEQVKSLFAQAVDSGLTPAFTIEGFLEGCDEARLESEESLNRYVLFHHKLLHDQLYAPPRGRG